MVHLSRLVGIFFVLAIFANGATATASSYAHVFANKNATGEELAKAFFALLSETGSPAGTVGTTPQQDAASKALVKLYLDPALVVQRATGERYVAADYLPADVDDFKIGDVRVTRPADGVIVARYSVRLTETLPDSAQVMGKDKAPRLTVFHWSASDARWKILSHANFNTPIAAICNTTSTTIHDVRSPANPDDQALGERLIGRFYDLVMQGNSVPLLNAEIQFQSASGVGYTTLAERKNSTQYVDIRFRKPVVTRNGRLLVVSTYNTTEQRTLMQNNHLRASEAGNLSTFIQGADGQWSMIAVAAFAPPKALPDGVACVKPGPIEKAP
jgi:hypothetical protein